MGVGRWVWGGLPCDTSRILDTMVSRGFDSLVDALRIGLAKRDPQSHSLTDIIPVNSSG